jgi:hypothetical protein
MSSLRHTCLGQPPIARRASKLPCLRQLQCLIHPRSTLRTTMMQAASTEATVDQTLNPLVASLKVSKTMALTDLARSMRESGVDVSSLISKQWLIRGKLLIRSTPLHTQQAHSRTGHAAKEAIPGQSLLLCFHGQFVLLRLHAVRRKDMPPCQQNDWQSSTSLLRSMAPGNCLD